MGHRWPSVEAIAAHHGVQRDTLYKWLASKRLPAHKVGRLWKFRRDEADDWVTAGGGSSDTARDAHDGSAR